MAESRVVDDRWKVRLQELASFGPDWNDEGGKPASEKTILMTEELLTELGRHNIPRGGIFLQEDGSISLEWATVLNYMEIVVDEVEGYDTLWVDTRTGRLITDISEVNDKSGSVQKTVETLEEVLEIATSWNYTNSYFVDLSEDL